jgi:hypothetical protein
MGQMAREEGIPHFVGKCPLERLGRKLEDNIMRTLRI